VEFEAKVVKSEQRRVLISCLVEAGQYKKTGLFMPETWFHHKAERCAQLAKDAANPTQRSLLQEESRLWLQIAAAEERQEEQRKQARGRRSNKYRPERGL
jgi:hypothetical protein